MTAVQIIILVVCCLAALVAAVMAGRAIWKHNGGHRCRGSETGRRYVPGILESNRAFEGKISESNMDLVYGYTEISYKCSTCGVPFNNRIIGKVTK